MTSPEQQLANLLRGETLPAFPLHILGGKFDEILAVRLLNPKPRRTAQSLSLRS